MKLKALVKEINKSGRDIYLKVKFDVGAEPFWTYIYIQKTKWVAQLKETFTDDEETGLYIQESGEVGKEDD